MRKYARFSSLRMRIMRVLLKKAQLYKCRKEDAMNVNTELMTADELAKELRLRPETVKRMARDGKIPSLRISPKVLRFSMNAVLATLTQRKTEINLKSQGVNHDQK
jgi:excisionase family DNA binding protein